MTQSNFIAFAIFVAFVVYITAKGRLPLYLGFLGFGSASSSSTASSGGNPVSSALGTAQQATNLASSVGNLLGSSSPVNIISNDVTNLGF